MAAVFLLWPGSKLPITMAFILYTKMIKNRIVLFIIKYLSCFEVKKSIFFIIFFKKTILF